MIIPVLLAGGSGNRLWPLSRELYPKQCINLTCDDKSLIQQTLERVGNFNACGEAIVVCNTQHRFLIGQQLADSGFSAKVILEPLAKNTAPAIALAALEAQSRDPDAILVVLPADHLIEDQTAFNLALQQAVDKAYDNKLIAFGVVPKYPETGYGYIEAVNYGEISAIKAFHEKPDIVTARHYLTSGRHYWNSGMYVFKTSVFLQEMQDLQPQLYQSVVDAMQKKYADLDFIRVDEAAFSRCPSVSIDSGLMEQTENGVVVPYSGDWSDVGSWDSVYDIQDKDSSGNVLQGDIMLHNVTNSLIRSGERLVAAVGVDNLAIIDTPDALLVMSRPQAQDVKHIVTALKQKGRSEHRAHTRVHRPWGSYERLRIGHHYQIKHVNIKPGEHIAMQVHHHRAEHWIVVSGTAEVSIAGEKKRVKENESIYIRVGDVHSLHNPEDEVLEIIEVQTGDYLGEDDIVRFTDNYH